MRGAGRVVFAALMLLLMGVLNIFYGFGALGDARVLVNDTRLVFTDLNAYGWVLILIGAFQVGAGGSLMAGNTFGRVWGIAACSIGALFALLSIGGAFPWYSLAIFFLCIYVLHGIIVFGEDEREAEAGI